jgi:alkylation response protein AidB-like acyl-CoA dehydrogenase
MSALSAAALDRALGDPDDPGRLFSHQRIAALDEREEFPGEICRELDVLGLPAHYVPAEHGGALRAYPDSLALMRVVARRDLTTAIAHGKTFLGAVSVWVAGSPAQARALAARILDGGVVSWGLTEREHGSDLVAGEVRAEPTATGHRITGEKWLINNATRGQLLCLLARTDPADGPRSHSVLLVDKRTLAPDTFRTLPAPKLHGIRGADISGIDFTGAEVPADALIGEAGHGVETVVRSLQLTRTMCASLSLGAADAGLRLAVDYATTRRNYDRLVADLPQSRRLLATGYADLLLTEALTLVAARGVHSLTAELSVSSAVVKYLAPTTVDGLLTKLAKVLGSRALLTGDVFGQGRFQKIQRDHRIVGIFDGNTVVNLHSLINQFPNLVRGHRTGRVDTEGLATATDLSAALPAFDRDRLTLLSRTGASPVQALPAAADRLTGRAAELARELLTELARVVAGMAAHRPTAVEVPAAAFSLAEHYAACYAGAAAVQLFLANSSLWTDALWLEAVLLRVLHRLRPGRPEVAGADEVYERLARLLFEQHTAGTPFSLLPEESA